MPKPLPFPLVRMDEPEAGTSYAVTFQGVVKEHGPARENPFTDGVTPARELQVTLVDHTVEKLFYTLPKPFSFPAFPNDQVSALYRERAAGFGSSYGARLESSTTHALLVLFEDGAIGSAFDDVERLGFTFELDTQPLQEEPVDCGRRVHYPVIVTNGTRHKRVFPGANEQFTLESGQNVIFTLLDATRIEDAVCADAPALSIGYIVTPG